MASPEVSFQSRYKVMVSLNFFGAPILNRSLSLPEELRRAGVKDPECMTKEVALKALKQVERSCNRVVFWTKPVVLLALGGLALVVGTALSAVESIALAILGFAILFIAGFLLGQAIRSLTDARVAGIPNAFGAVAAEARSLICRVNACSPGGTVSVENPQGFFFYGSGRVGLADGGVPPLA